MKQICELFEHFPVIPTTVRNIEKQHLTKGKSHKQISHRFLFPLQSYVKLFFSINWMWVMSNTLFYRVYVYFTNWILRETSLPQHSWSRDKWKPRAVIVPAVLLGMMSWTLVPHPPPPLLSVWTAHCTSSSGKRTILPGHTNANLNTSSYCITCE